MIKPGVIAFATDSSREGIEDARAWLKEREMTPDKVRLYVENGMALVQVVKPVEIKLRDMT